MPLAKVNLGAGPNTPGGDSQFEAFTKLNANMDAIAEALELIRQDVAALAAKVAGTAPAPVALPAITYTNTSPVIVAASADGTAVPGSLSSIPANCTRSAASDGRLVLNAAKTAIVLGGTARTAGTTASITVTDTHSDGRSVSDSFTVSLTAAVGPDTSTESRTLDFVANTFSLGGSATEVVVGTRDSTGLLVTPSRNEGGITREQFQGNPGNATQGGWYLDGVSRTDIGVDANDSRFRAVRFTADDSVDWVQCAFLRTPNLNRPVTASIWYRAGSTNRARVQAKTNFGANGYTAFSGPVGALVAEAGNSDPAVAVGTSAIENVNVGNGIYRANFRVTPSSRCAASEWNVGISPDGVGDIIVLGACVWYDTPAYGDFTTTVGSYVEGGTNYPPVTAQLSGAALAAAKRTGSVFTFSPAGIATVDTNGLVTALGSGGRIKTIKMETLAAMPAIRIPNSTRLLGTNIGSGSFEGEPQNIAYGDTDLFQYYFSKGMNVLRVAVKWERLQPTANGELDADVLGKLKALADFCEARGIWFLCNLHNYMKYNNVSLANGGGGRNFTHFSEVWVRIVKAFASYRYFIAGTMNEPAIDSTANVWKANYNCVLAIRNAGFKGPITIAGDYYTGAHSFLGASGGGMTNAAACEEYFIKPGGDPLNNTYIEVHQYLDPNSSGASQYTDCPVNAGRDRLVAVTEWARKVGLPLCLGEFAGQVVYYTDSSKSTPITTDQRPGSVSGWDRANYPVQGAAGMTYDWGQCGPEVDKILAYMDANKDVWRIATWWNGSRRVRWCEPYSIQPDIFELDATITKSSTPVDKPGMLKLLPYISGWKNTTIAAVGNVGG